MSKLLDMYESIDISLSSEDEEDMPERASTPLARELISKYRIVLNASLSPAKAVADEEVYFDISKHSLEADCQRMRLNSTLESLESGELANTSPKSTYSTMKESPERPDEQKQEEDDTRSNSGVFVVEGHCAPSLKSIPSVVIADYLEQVARENAS